MLREDKVVTISDGLSGADPKPRKKNSPDLTCYAPFTKSINGTKIQETTHRR